jgi:hypothetical protein
VPARENPYRADGWADFTPTHEGALRPAIGHFEGADISTQPIGLAAIDIDSIARRNYTLGRKQARADVEGELQHLRRQLSQRPATAYDEGYDAGMSAAEHEALDQIIGLLGPARLIAEEYLDGRAARKRLTPKQREDRAAELAGYVRGIYNLLESMQPLVEGEQATISEPRTVEGLAALREFMAKHGPDYTFTVR